MGSGISWWFSGISWWFNSDLMGLAIDTMEMKGIIVTIFSGGVGLFYFFGVNRTKYKWDGIYGEWLWFSLTYCTYLVEMIRMKVYKFIFGGWVGSLSQFSWRSSRYIIRCFLCCWIVRHFKWKYIQYYHVLYIHIQPKSCWDCWDIRILTVDTYAYIYIL